MLHIQAPVVVEWCDVSTTPRSFSYLAERDPGSVQLNLQFDEQKHTASFKIRISAPLRDDLEERSAGHDTDYLYIWIDPADVVLLIQDPAHRLPAGTGTLHSTTTCLRLVLSKPTSVLAPADAALPLSRGRDSRLLSSLGLLAKQTIFSIHVEEHHIQDLDAFQRFCQACGKGDVRLSPRNGLRGFYKGRGANVIEDWVGPSESSQIGQTKEQGPIDVSITSDPPPYIEKRPVSPPSSSAQQLPNKRQRVSEGIVSTCTQFLTDYQTRMGQFLRSQQAEMQETLGCISNQLENMDDRIGKMVDERFGEEMSKVGPYGDKAREWEHAIGDIVQNEVVSAFEKIMDQERGNLVDGVVEECLNRLKDDLESGLVTITLPR